MTKTPEDRPKRPWRDTIEGVTVAIVLAVFLKYFIIEAYKIPSGSMQPTLMGNPESGVSDRILVDKLSFHARDPRRFEVIVFRHPLQQSMNMIKRLVGLPGEELKIEGGDLWVREEGEADYRILRRPRTVQESMWKEVGCAGGWRPLSGTEGWTVREDEVRARGDGGVRFPEYGSSVKNGYGDGYPAMIARALARKPREAGRINVGDLRLDCRVEALAGCTGVTLELQEGARRYLFKLPGPAAGEEEAPTIGVEGLELEPAEAASPWRLPAGEAVRVIAQNLDDRLELRIGGREVASLEVEPNRNQQSAVLLRARGEGADFRKVRLFRDVHYLSDSEKSGYQSHWKIPEGYYVVLGDNTLDSADARDWRATRYRTRSGEVIRGNLRTGENPVAWPRENPREHFFVDQFGERHVLEPEEARPLGRPETGIMVPRELITGRAVLVFWPMFVWRGLFDMDWVNRLQWIR